MKFTQIGCVEMSNDRSLVISETSDDRISLGQRIICNEIMSDNHQNSFPVFLKGTIILSREQVKELREILNTVEQHT